MGSLNSAFPKVHGMTSKQCLLCQTLSAFLILTLLIFTKTQEVNTITPEETLRHKGRTRVETVYIAPEPMLLTTTLQQQCNTKIQSSKWHLNCLLEVLILIIFNSEIDYFSAYIGNTNDTSSPQSSPGSDFGISNLKYYTGQKEPLQTTLRQHHNLAHGSLLSHQENDSNSWGLWAVKPQT